MIVSFTQTYGNDRKQLLDIYAKDEKLIEFKNLFDLNIYSFHNVNDETINYFKQINKVKNTKELIFYNIPYTDTIKFLKSFIIDKNCTHFFFSQDDTFSFNNQNVDFKELINYVKEFKSNFLLCLAKKGNNEFSKMLNKNIIKKDTFYIYEYTSLDFLKIEKSLNKDESEGPTSNDWWPFDDTPFICTYDLLDTIYDDKFFSQNRVWEAEFYLRTKFTYKSIPRFTTDQAIFKNYNIIGRTLSKKEDNILQLKQKNLI